MQPAPQEPLIFLTGIRASKWKICISKHLTLKTRSQRYYLIVQSLSQFIQQPVQILVSLPLVFDFADRVHHGCMMLAPKLAANLRQRSLRHLLGEEHGDLAREDDSPGITLGLDFRHTKPKLLGNRFLDGFDGDLARLRVDEILQYLLCCREIDLSASERTIGDQADERTLEFTNVGPDIGGDI